MHLGGLGGESLPAVSHEKLLILNRITLTPGLDRVFAKIHCLTNWPNKKVAETACLDPMKFVRSKMPKIN